VTGERTSPIARVALVLGALVVIAWLAVGLRPAVPETRAKGVLTQQPLTAADRAHARRLLRDARTLNPDTRPRVTEGALLVASKQPRAAAAVLRGVVAAEPENAEAWALLTAAYRGYDRRRAQAAFARFQALKPPVRP
jgi:predicted Zn-dependent protease